MMNTNNDIPCFTIPALSSMRPASDVAAPALNDLLIAMCDTEMEPFKFPCRIDAVIISICIEGECVIVSNLKEYTLTKGRMFVCSPKNILHIRSSQNFRSDVLVVAPELLRESHINLNSLMPLLLEFTSSPCLPLTESDFNTLHNLISIIAHETLVLPQTSFSIEVISGLISASISKIGDLLTRYSAEHPKSNEQKRNRADEYLKLFMMLLTNHYKEEHSVSFYAHELHITPKYLTTLIKRISGKSVSDWIDECLILEAKTLLRYSTMSVQEIAYYLHFPNQSFFGSYFKRITGMSPSQYKIE